MTDKKAKVEVVKQVWWLRGLNFIGGACCGRVIAKLLGFYDLTPAALLKTAKWRSGNALPLDESKPLSPTGEDSKLDKEMLKFKEPLHVVCKDLTDAQENLTFSGRVLMHGIFSQMLATRMRVFDYIRAHHAALQLEEIKRPVFVVGLPRTGTTFTFNLLASDPNYKYPRNWQALCPTLPEKKAKLQVWAGMFAILHANPELKAVHEMGVDEPEECTVILNASLLSFFYLILQILPTYFDYMFDKAELHGVYRFHKYVLQILQHRFHQKGSSGAERNWLLKAPVHLPYLDILIDVYPDACVVFTHRNLDNVFASTASLIKHFHRISHRSIDLTRIGSKTTEMLSQWLNRTVAVRNNPKYAKNFYDLSYKELVKDPADSLQKIYKHFERPYTEETRDAHLRCIKNRPQAKHGTHQYTLDEFDMSSEKIAASCDAYLKQYRHLL